MAATAAWYRATRTLARPPRMWRVRLGGPPSSAEGAGAARAGRQRPDPGDDDLPEVGQDGGIDPVRLGELADALGEIADLAGVDDDGGQVRREQGPDRGLLVRAGGLEDDALGGEGSDPGDELL